MGKDNDSGYALIVNIAKNLLLFMMRTLKIFFKNSSRSVFEMGQKFGLNILPKHFYSNIPDIQYLKETSFWLTRSSMAGVEMNILDEQINFLKECCSVETSNQLISKNIHKRAIAENGEDGGYGPIEAEFLHCFIKKIKPARVIQVGCGVSTSVMLTAADEISHPLQITCIEPYPSKFLKDKKRIGKITLISKKAQEVQQNVFTKLEEGDLLFIDSTHTVKPGSEVNYLILEILPRLKKNVYIHFHDIYFPYDYGRNILTKDIFFWLESTLLQAFLTGNRKFKIILCQSILHYEKSDEMKQILPSYIPQDNHFGLAKGETKGKHFPASLYLKVME